MKPAVHRAGTAAAVLVILLVTLRPGSGGVSPWCLRCGSVLADGLRNILLFLPLGVMLRLGGWPARRVIRAAALLSFAVEAIQIVIPGRDPSLADLAANTLGAALGAWLAGSPAAWLTPTPRHAARLALLWSAAVVAVLAAGRPLLMPALPSSRYYGQWVPQLGHLSWYGGSVRQASLGARALPDGPLAASADIRAALRAGDTLAIEAIAGPPSGALAPIFSIADDRGREVVLVGAEGEDLVLRYRTRAAWLGLEQPSVRWRGAFLGVAGGADLAIRVSRLGPDVCLEIGGRTSCPGPSPWHGWAFVVPESWIGERARGIAGVMWMACLVLPACYWLARARWRA